MFEFCELNMDELSLKKAMQKITVKSSDSTKKENDTKNMEQYIVCEETQTLLKEFI